MLVGRNDSALAGTVHLDGAYVGGPVRPENRKEDRVDRRLTENQNPDKRCLLVMRPTYRREETERNGAYREDPRRWSNGRIFLDIVTQCARAWVSRDWCGYWQGNHRLGEALAL